MLPPPAGPVSVRQFAKLDGCSHTLVAKAVKNGKLPVSASGLIDPALAGTGWRKRNRQAAEVETLGVNPVKVSTPRAATVFTPSGRVETPSKRRGQAGANPPLDPADLEDEDFIAEVLAGRFALTGDAERVKENGLAVRSLLAARREAGDVVNLEVADALLFEMARSLRDSWLNWPSRVAPLIAATVGVPVDALLEALNEHVQQHLAELGEPEADFAGADQG